MTKRERTGQTWGEGWVKERTRADGTVTFQARWYDADGTRPGEHAKTFPTRDAAEDHLRAIRRAKRDGRYRPPSAMTVSDLVAEYVDRAASRISERTVLTYRARARRMIDPTIGRRALDGLAPLDVQRWIDALGRQGFAPSTVHAAVAVLMGALREAALLGITDRHLGQGVRRPALGRPTATVWTEAEARRVLAAVRDDPIYGALYHLALATGMRPGELRALKWADVDLDAGVVTVRRTISKGADGSEVIADRTKSKRPRAVAVAPPIAERLRWHKARQAERRLASDRWRDAGVVFDGGDGHWIWQGPWQRWHRAMCARVGVPVIRCHDLRHTSATLELATGTHPRVVSERLGHSTVTMTLDRYTHVSHETQRVAAEALAGRLFAPEPPADASESLADFTGVDETHGRETG